MKRQIEAVLFDLDDTLHDDTLSVLRAARETSTALARRAQIDAGALCSTFVEVLEAFWQQHNSAGSPVPKNIRQDMWMASLRRYGIQDTDLAAMGAQTFDKARRRHYQLFPGAIKTLAQLRAKGVRLGLVTNGFRTTHTEKIELLQLSGSFDGIFLSDDIGVSKPDPRIFLHACNTLATSPARSAMVGDRYDKDIAGALALGMLTVWLNIRSERVPDGAPPPAFTVSGIKEVYPALKPFLCEVRELETTIVNIRDN